MAGELSPGAGPVEGGSIVRVPLEGLAWLREDGFTWHDGANNSKRVHLGMQASCKFGVAVVPATVAYESEDSDDGDVEHLECVSPNATAAGVAVELGGPSDGGVGVWRAAPLSLGTLPFGDDAADGLYGLNAADAEGMREAVEAAAAEEAANACKPDGCAGGALFAAAGAAFAGRATRRRRCRAARSPRRATTKRRRTTRHATRAPTSRRPAATATAARSARTKRRRSR